MPELARYITRIARGTQQQGLGHQLTLPRSSSGEAKPLGRQSSPGTLELTPNRRELALSALRLPAQSLGTAQLAVPQVDSTYITRLGSLLFLEHTLNH